MVKQIIVFSFRPAGASLVLSFSFRQGLKPPAYSSFVPLGLCHNHGNPVEVTGKIGRRWNAMEPLPTNKTHSESSPSGATGKHGTIEKTTL
jgi:hypothetical protein